MAEEKKTFPSVLEEEKQGKGVGALADRPNLASTYGKGGLTAAELKKWFDGLASLIIEKYNLLGEDMKSGAVAEYIGVPEDAAFPSGSNITKLKDVLKGIVSGALAQYLVAYVKEGADGGAGTKVSLQAFVLDALNRLGVAEGDIDALEGRATSLEDSVGNDDTEGTVKGRVKSIEGRMTTAESDIDGINSDIGSDGEEDTVKGRIKTAETDIDNLESAIGTDDTKDTVKGRIKKAESDIDDLTDRMTDAEVDIDNLESAIGTNSTEGTVKGRIKVVEDDINRIETQTKIEFDPVKKVFYLSVAGNRVSDLDVITKGVITEAKYEEATNSIVVTFASGETASVPLTDLVDEAIVDSILKERYDALITGTVKTEISNNAELKASVNAAQTSAETARSFANASGSSASAAQTAQTASETAKTDAETAKAGADVAKAAAENAQRIAEEQAEIATTAAETAVQAAESAQQSAGTANSVVSSLAPRVSAAEKRLTNLEKGITPDPFSEDASVAYVKTVPENALPFAAIERVGGMSYKSKNLFDHRNVNRTGIGITFVTDGDYIKLNGTKVDGLNAQSVSTPNLILQPGTYTLSIRMISGTITRADSSATTDGVYFSINKSAEAHRTKPHVLKVGDVGVRTFTITEPLTVESFDIIPGYAGTGNIYTDVVVACQLERADAVTDFEPYFEGIRHAAVTAVESEGVNLAETVDGTHPLGTTGQVQCEFADGVAKFMFNGFVNGLSSTLMRPYTSVLLPEGTYTIAIYYTHGIMNTTLYISNEDTVEIIYTRSVAPEKITTHTFALSTPTTVSWSCYFYNGTASAPISGECVFEVMLVRGNTALPFEPYVKHTFPIPEAMQALDGYGWGISKEVNNYFSYDENGRVTWHKKFGGVDMGTMNWSYNADNKWWYSTALKGATVLDYTNPRLLAENYKTASWGDKFVGTVAMDGSGNIIILSDDSTTKPSGMLYYELAEPETTDITDLISPDNYIRVEGSGGTLTFANEYAYDVPSTVVYQIKGAST
jgi:hypothetical protein